MESDLKQVIVLRNDLNMRKGKMVTQGAHASMAAIISPFEVSDGDMLYPGIKNDDLIRLWLVGKFTKICVRVDSEEELLNIYKKAGEANIHRSLIQDSGATEFNGVPTFTAVAIGPDYNEAVNSITGHLKLL